MSGLQIGELAAVATALLWTLSALIWTFSAQHIGALAVSFLRLPITCVYVLAYARIFRGLWLPGDADGRTWLILGVSGFFGFFLADVCFFKALMLIGPRLALLVQVLTAPLTSLIAWALLGDRLSPQQWWAMAITIAGVVWVVLERRGGKSPHDSRELSRADPGADRGGGSGRRLRALQARDRAVRRRRRHDDPRARGPGRLFRADLVHRRWPSMWAAMQKGRVMAAIVLGAFVGPFLGVALYLVAVRHCHAGVATAIVGTTPVLILPFVILLYHEKVSLRGRRGVAVGGGRGVADALDGVYAFSTTISIGTGLASVLYTGESLANSTSFSAGTSDLTFSFMRMAL